MNFIISFDASTQANIEAVLGGIVKLYLGLNGLWFIFWFVILGIYLAVASRNSENNKMTIWNWLEFSIMPFVIALRIHRDAIRLVLFIVTVIFVMATTLLRMVITFRINDRMSGWLFAIIDANYGDSGIVSSTRKAHEHALKRKGEEIKVLNKQRQNATMGFDELADFITLAKLRNVPLSSVERHVEDIRKRRFNQKGQGQGQGQGKGQGQGQGQRQNQGQRQQEYAYANGGGNNGGRGKGGNNGVGYQASNDPYAGMSKKDRARARAMEADYRNGGGRGNGGSRNGGNGNGNGQWNNGGNWNGDDQYDDGGYNNGNQWNNGGYNQDYEDGDEELNLDYNGAIGVFR